MLKNKFGITLITLVITIVVMLILAGVVVNFSLGENGIIGKAQNAMYKYKNATEQERDMLDYAEEFINRNNGNIIMAEQVQYTPDSSLNWTGVTNVKQALDYLYNNLSE